MPHDSRVPRIPEHQIAGLTGVEAAQAGRTHLREGDVGDLTWDLGEGVLSGTVQTGAAAEDAARVRVQLELLGSGDPAEQGPEGELWIPVASRCDCPARTSCEHAAAVLYAVSRIRTAGEAEQPGSAERGGWRALLDPLMVETAEQTPRLPLAIGIELLAEPLVRTRYAFGNEPATPAHLHAGRPLHLGIRPMRAGKRGNWIKSGLSWRTFEFRGMNQEYVPAHADALTQLFTVAESERSYTRGPVEHLWLESIRTPLIWEFLVAARAAGVELVPQGSLGEVRLAQLARVSLDLEAVGEDVRDGEGSDLELRVAVSIDGQRALLPRPIGESAVMDVRLGSRTARGGERIDLVLAPAEIPLPRQIRSLLDRGAPLLIPRADTAEFFREAYPRLRRHITVTSTDTSVPLPSIPPPSLHLQAAYSPDDALALHWSWRYHDPERTVAVDRRTGGHRDLDHEDSVLAEVRTLWPTAALDAAETLHGVDTALFTEQVLDPLRSLRHVQVVVTGQRHRYRELLDAPQVRVTQQDSPGKHDWFDLAFEVTIEGRTIAFPTLFRALAEGRSKLLLPDRTYFSLEHESLDGLRRLIVEGEALAEWEPDHQRISRYHLDFWDDITAVADEARESAAFTAHVGALRAVSRLDPPQLPEGFRAELRPYQREGLAWLHFLHRQGMGGILADDMGLGKTLQTLALIATVRAQRRSAPRHPFLVVAPSSVLGVWEAEAARFAPGLDLRVVDRTSRARGRTLSAVVDGADIVVTSYTLLRIDAQEFTDQEWEGLILDEAQFVKNRATAAHRTARRLRAPFRLAVTGTPLENSLGDLWSLLALTVPGLFPSAVRFTREYARPIESGEDPARMARLRRRIRPFMLRRTKELVASDLPEKQEQVARIPLEPAHRELYDSVLQRERKKVLGLIDEDMDRNRFIVFRSLTLLRMLALDPAIVEGGDHEVPSSKMNALLGKLEEVLAEGHRVLIFSQFTSFLRRVGDELLSRDVPFSYLDGSTRDRSQVIDGFRRGEDPVFLISLKAGGFGLTLTEADYVFLLDPWWNPAAEAQAVDRTHRIGQTRNVMVYRMVAEGTIEEKVLALQERKAALFDSLTDGGDAFSRSLTAGEIRELFAQEPRS
ncbi:SNF2-related protein [Brachybacterium hainanense]|uniref:SNF2-related protein n=1 Tax=Brachybacterium hainanense TaxID=1541174 RepID=A0ABV6RGC4_9MICO